MHLKRWLSGLVIAPGLILFVLFAPPVGFLIAMLALTFLGLREFYHLCLPAISRQERVVGFVLGLWIPLSLYLRDPRYFIAGLALVIFFLFIRLLFQRDEFALRLEKVSRHILAILYVPFFLGHYVLMHNTGGGPFWVLSTVVMVYFGDIAAFYVGRTWGRRKMAPTISPNKTMEGGLGAIIGSVAGALVCRFLFFPQQAIYHFLALGAGVGVVGQFGDLFESLLKRSAKVKDSGGLIPGHGGLLDRIDSVLFAGPFVFYYAWMAGLNSGF